MWLILAEAATWTANDYVAVFGGACAAAGGIIAAVVTLRKQKTEERDKDDARADKSYAEMIADLKATKVELIGNIKELQGKHSECEQKAAKMEGRMSVIEDTVRDERELRAKLEQEHDRLKETVRDVSAKQAECEKHRAELLREQQNQRGKQ